jgi:hypothetical protein
MKHNFHYIIRVLRRWALILAMLAVLLFAAAGTTTIGSIRAYLGVFSALLLVTMSAVDHQLARQRTTAIPDAVAPHLRAMSGALFLLTVSTAAFTIGRLHVLVVPLPIRWFASCCLS